MNNGPWLAELVSWLIPVCRLSFSPKRFELHVIELTTDNIIQWSIVSTWMLLNMIYMVLTNQNWSYLQWKGRDLKFCKHWSQLFGVLSLKKHSMIATTSRRAMLAIIILKIQNVSDRRGGRHDTSAQNNQAPLCSDGIFYPQSKHFAFKNAGTL